MNGVLDLVLGLDCNQTNEFRQLVVPVLRELRTCIQAGKSRLVIDLDNPTPEKLFKRTEAAYQEQGKKSTRL